MDVTARQVIKLSVMRDEVLTTNCFLLTLVLSNYDIKIVCVSAIVGAERPSNRNVILPKNARAVEIRNRWRKLGNLLKMNFMGLINLSTSLFVNRFE